MKVKIGPYKNWFGPYKFVKKLFWFLSEDTQDKIVDKIPVGPFNFINKLKGERKIKVRIDDHDIWNMDETLSHIILPMLTKLKDQKHGTPRVNKEDVPEHLLSKYDEENPYNEEIWNWIMDEMIWAFQQINEKYPDETFYIYKGRSLTIQEEQMDKYSQRINNGTRLFGVYYQSLWD